MSGSNEQRREEAATRRRWLSLAELVAVAGVLIGALTLWNSWSQRRTEVADKQEAAAKETRAARRLDLTATVEDDGAALLLKDATHDIRDIAFAFPRALGVPAQQPVADARIDAATIAAPLLQRTDGGPDDRVGTLPTLVTVAYWDGDDIRRATAVYDVIWRTEGRTLQSRAFKLDGIKLRQRGGTQATVDALWKRVKL